MPREVTSDFRGLDYAGSPSLNAGPWLKHLPLYRRPPEGDGGRCTDRTCDLTRVKGVLYR